MKRASCIEIKKKTFNVNKTNTLNQKKLSISLLKDDLTIQETNAIVNAANSQLLLGAGVAGAIRSKGGEKIQIECDEIISKENKNKDLTNGDVAYTNIGKFQNKNLQYIFHAVGPVYYNGKRNEKRDLTNCFLNCFKLADKLKLSSIAIPPISTGIFGYPKEKGADVFFDCVEKYFIEFLKYENEESEELQNLNTKESKIKNDSLFDMLQKVSNNQEDDYENINKTYQNECSLLDTNSDVNKESKVNEVKVSNYKNYVNINEAVNIPDRKQKKKDYKDINQVVEDQQSNNNINSPLSIGTNNFSKMQLDDDNNYNKPGTNFQNNEIPKNTIGDNYEKRESKEEKKNVVQESKLNNNSLYPNYDNHKEILNVNEYFKKEKNTSSRIIRCKFDEGNKSEIGLENFTLNEINMAIIDKITYEVFSEVLQEKFLKWKDGKSEYEISYHEY